jgi:preprotein translocase subunit SecY
VAEFGKILVFVGVLIALFGIVLIFAGRMHLPIGRLPGDIVYRGKNTTFYFPLATCIVLSVVLSLVLYLVARTGHR